MRQALTGHSRTHHTFLVSHLLAHLDYLDKAIETASSQIDTVIAPFAEELARLDTIHGVNQRTAEVFIAEIGVDMMVFPIAKHLLLRHTTYQDPGTDYYGRRHAERVHRYAIQALERQGYRVTLEPAA